MTVRGRVGSDEGGWGAAAAAAAVGLPAGRCLMMLFVGTSSSSLAR